MSARDPLAVVWARADAAEARFSADEVSSWPDGHEALLTEARIIRRDGNTTIVVCDACADGHVEDVVRIESPPGSPVRAYIHCPDAGRVAVPLDRLKQWVVDFDGLAGAVASGLDLAGEVEEVVPARLWFLGRTTLAGRSRDVLLARGATWIDAPNMFGPPDRLSPSRGALLFVPGLLPSDPWAGDPPTAIALKVVARFADRRLAIDRDHIESLLAGGVAERARPVSSGSKVGGRPVLSVDEARGRLLAATRRFREGRDETEPLTNVGLAKARRRSEETISNWLKRAEWTLDDLDVEWTRRRRKKPE